MMTRKRKLLILVVAVPVLFVAVALLYLNFADLSGWRDTVATLVSDAIGRELKINGEFAPEIGLSTRLVATDITLANPAWSDDPHMVSVDRLTGEIDLLSLVFGPITISDVDITGARVLFEVDTEGRFNWVFETDGSAEGDGGDVELAISHAVVKDLQLVYAPPRDQALQAALAHLEITDDGTGMLDIDLDGSFEGTPLEISGRLGTFIGLINAAAVEHDLTGRLADAEFGLRGTIDDLGSLTGVEGDASASGSELAHISATFGLDPIVEGPFTFKATVKPSASGSDIDLDAAAGGMTARIIGVVDSLTEPTSLDATVTASGPSIRAVGALTGVADLPDEEFSVSGGLRWEGFPITFKKVEITVGDNSLIADGVLGAPPQMLGTDFTIQGEGPNVSSLGALAGIDLPGDSFLIGGRVVRVEGGLQVDNVEAHIGRTIFTAEGRVGDPPVYAGTTLNIHAEGPNIAHFEDLIGIGLPAEPFAIDGRLNEGDQAIALEGVSARVGRTTLRVEGQVKTEKGLSGTSLRIRAQGHDASQMAHLAGVTGVPQEAWSVKGGLAVLDSGYRLNGVSATLGSLTVNADGRVVAGSDFVGTDLQLHIEDPDLSHPASIAGISGLPRDSFMIDTRVRVEDPGFRLDDFKATVGDMELEVDGQIGAPPELDGTQVHITARGPKLSSLNQYLDQTGLPSAQFSITGNAHITEGAYALDGVVAEVDGNRVTLAGTVHPVKGLAGTDLDIEFSAPDLGRAGRLVSGFADLPALPSEPLTLDTRVLVDEAGYQVERLRVTHAKAEVSVDGRVGSLPGLLGTDLTINADGPNASLFVALAGVTMPVAPFQIKGRVERDDAGFRFHGVTARLGEYRAAVDGTLGELPKLIGTELEIHASGPGTGLIKELAGISGLPDRPFELDGEFTGTTERFSTRNLRATFGPSDLEGSFTVDITGKPAVQARLTSNHLDLSRLRERLEARDEDAEAAAGAEPSPPVKKTRLIPDEPLDLAWLEKADADVAIRVAKLVLPAKYFRDVSIDLHLDGGRLEIRRMAAVGRDQGSVDGTFVLEPIGNQYRLQTTLLARQLRLDVRGSEVDRADQPSIDIDIDLEARGATPHGLASSANGSLQVVIGKGVMDRGVLDFVTADILLTLLNAFNPFAKEDVATELQCGVMLVTFENGLATLEPMAVQSDKMTMLGKGKIDLGTEKLDLEWITKPRKGIGLSASMITNPYIKLGGTLAEPAVELKPLEAVASTSVAVATLGLSLVAKGMYDRVTAEKKVCKEALEKIGRQSGDTSKKSKKKQR